jgi:hypothetical protein
MKFSIVLLVVASAVLINQADSLLIGGRLGLGLGLGVGRLGLGLGGFGLGGLGLGLPFGGLGLGLGLPFPPVLPIAPLGLGLPFGGLGFGGLGLGFGFRRAFIGKRGVEEVPIKNITTCRFITNSSLIRCDGVENIECPVEVKLDIIKDITVRLPGLSVIPQPIKVTGQKEIDALALYSRVIGSTSTLVHPITRKPIILSIYSAPVCSEPGFCVKEAKCFERIESFCAGIGYEFIRFSLFNKL